MRRIYRYLPVLLLPVCMQLARAQSSFDLALGFGAVQDKASGAGIEGDPTSANFFNTCVPNSTPTCTASKSLSGPTMGFQGTIMLNKWYGVGGEVNFQPNRQDYVVFPAATQAAGGINLKTRTTFYDFNGVFQPIKTKKVALQVQGGVGGANIRFYTSGSASSGLLGNQSYNQYFASANHFQVHAGVGVQLFVTEHVFIKPQFDLHYVPNLMQFGSNAVKQESVWVGFSWGS